MQTADHGAGEGSKASRPLLKSVRLKRHLVAELRAGRLQAGVPLPSEPRLAEQFNVSRPTVRRALEEMVKEGLIRREQGRGTFVTDDATQRLRKDTTSFALLVYGSQIAAAVPMLQGFEQACRKSHHNMLLFDSENDLNQQGALILRLSQMDIGGVALHPVTSEPTPVFHITALQDRGIPVVFCHRSVEEVHAPLLSIDHEKQGYVAGKALAENGHRRVALAFGQRAGTFMNKHIRGIRGALGQAGGSAPDEFIYCGKSASVDYSKSEEELREWLRQMLEHESPPTAIWAAVDDFAEAIYFALQRMGVRVPEDISILGCGDIQRNSTFLRRLTSVASDGAEIGRRAVEILGQMQGGLRPLRDRERVAMPLTMTQGETLGPARQPHSPLSWRAG
ncbi:MAG: GntR family transcriptional regulator [Pirellulales bacterium]|nr:GntR family transcriptional regulator [Pirellulales bacterium]